MRLNKKVAAYTLVELMVVMLLSGILSAAVYGMFFWLISQYHDYETRRHQAEQVMQVSRELERLFFEASRIEAGRSNQLYFYLQEQEVMLQFEGDYVLRQLGHQVDTLQATAELRSVAERKVFGREPLVETATLSFILGKEELQRVYIKQYDARTLMPASQTIEFTWQE